MGKTKIDWCDKVWNPVTGCTKISAGCKNCYASSIAHRFWGERKFTDVQCHADRLGDPGKWKQPQRVFVDSMSDLFHQDVSFKFIEVVFYYMKLYSQHTYIILTKRPARMLEFFNWWPLDCPKNVCLGVSVENQEMANERIPLLLETPAVNRIVSVEPMLGPIDITEAMYGKNPPGMNHFGLTEGFGYEAMLDWIICGAESGPARRPFDVDWARSLRDQCQAAGVPFFLKQMTIDGKLVKEPYLDGRQWIEFPKDGAQ